MAFSTADNVFSGSCPDAPRWAIQMSFFMVRGSGIASSS
jgi:hypothetical protein